MQCELTGLPLQSSYRLICGSEFMRYLVWVLRLLVFLVVLLFALKNTDPVQVSFFADYTLNNVPLIIVMLVAFLLGLLLGLLMMLLVLMRKKRELAKTKRDVARLEQRIDKKNPDPMTTEAIAPLAPL